MNIMWKNDDANRFVKFVWWAIDTSFIFEFQRNPEYHRSVISGPAWSSGPAVDDKSNSWLVLINDRVEGLLLTDLFLPSRILTEVQTVYRKPQLLRFDLKFPFKDRCGNINRKLWTSGYMLHWIADFHCDSGNCEVNCNCKIVGKGRKNVSV